MPLKSLRERAEEYVDAMEKRHGNKMSWADIGFKKARPPRNTPARSLAALHAEVRQRRQDAACELKEWLVRRMAKPGYLSPQTRAEFETAIADLEVG